MAAPTPDLVRDVLRDVRFPGFRHDIVTLGMVGEDIRVGEGRVVIPLRPGTERAEVIDRLRQAIAAAVGRLPGIAAVDVHVVGAETARAGAPFAGRTALPGVAHVVAVASAKGGVGKSTVAANVAVALAQMGRSVGVVDADVYGPSLPLLFGTNARPGVTPDRRIHPVEQHGVKLMSMGFLLDEESPVIWRGPIVMGIVRQFLRDVDWGRLDLLIVDLPPGTGDAQLTLVQQVPVTGGLIVTTPQDVALLDVGRGMAMFAQVSTPVLGVVENMDGYVCPQCGTEDAVFGAGGAERLARRFGVPLLARLPIVPALTSSGDAGSPLVATDPAHPVSRRFTELAARLVVAVERTGQTATGAGA